MAKRVRKRLQEEEDTSYKHVAYVLAQPTIMQVLLQYLSLKRIRSLALTCHTLRAALLNLSVEYAYVCHLKASPIRLNRVQFTLSLRFTGYAKCVQLAWKIQHSKERSACDEDHNIELVASTGRLDGVLVALKHYLMPIHPTQDSARYFQLMMKNFAAHKDTTPENVWSVCSAFKGGLMLETICDIICFLFENTTVEKGDILIDRLLPRLPESTQMAILYGVCRIGLQWKSVRVLDAIIARVDGPSIQRLVRSYMGSEEEEGDVPHETGSAIVEYLIQNGR